MSDQPQPAGALRSIAALLVLASRLDVRPRWLAELVGHLGDALPHGPPRNPRAIVIGRSDDLL